MKNIIEYKGYVGSVEFLEDEKLFYGTVQGIRSLIQYQGTTAEEFVTDFHNAIDDYLEMCKAGGTAPERAFKGSYNVRIKPELHKGLAIRAINDNMSLNQATEQAIICYLK